MKLADFVTARFEERTQAVLATGNTGEEFSHAVAIEDAAHQIAVFYIDALGPNLSTEWGEHMRGGLRFAMHQLATVFADHPDYDEDWRP